MKNAVHQKRRVNNNWKVQQRRCGGERGRVGGEDVQGGRMRRREG